MRHYLTLTLALILSFGICSAQSSKQVSDWLATGNDYLKEHKLDPAITYLDSGYKAAIKLRDKKLQARFCTSLGHCYFEKNDKMRANWYLNNAIGFYKELKLTKEEQEVRKYQGGNSLISFDKEKSGGIEIGSTGVKYTILSFEIADGELIHIIHKDGSSNTQVIDFTDSAVNNTVDAVSKWYDTLLYNQVDPDKIFIVISSGVHQEAVRKWGAQIAESKLDAFRQRVDNKVKTMTGHSIEILSTCKEVELTIRGILPQAVRTKASLIDIGSGNTKGGTFYSNGALKDAFDNSTSCVDIPWGSKSLGKLLEGKDVAAATAIFNEKVLSIINSQIDTKRALTDNRDMYYYTGGAYWALCNYLYPEKIQDEKTAITKKDIYRYYDMAANDYDKLVNPDLSALSGAQLEQAKNEIKNSQKTFDKNKILAGAMIMKAVADKIDQTGDGHIKMKFIRYGYVGWLAGYIRDNKEAEKNQLNNKK